VSVSRTIVLPDRPTVGTLTFKPLGGDGEVAPRSSYELRAFSIAGDAGGGTATLVITLDSVYESVIAQASYSATSSAAAQDLYFQIRSYSDTGVQLQQDHTVPAVAILGSQDGVARALWVPPPIFKATDIRMVCNNVDATETYAMNVTIYNFNKRASERTPLNVLLASLPRGSSLQ